MNKKNTKIDSSYIILKILIKMIISTANFSELLSIFHLNKCQIAILIILFIEHEEQLSLTQLIPLKR